MHQSIGFGKVKQVCEVGGLYEDVICSSYYAHHFKATEDQKVNININIRSWLA